MASEKSPRRLRPLVDQQTSFLQPRERSKPEPQVQSLIQPWDPSCALAQHAPILHQSLLPPLLLHQAWGPDSLPDCGLPKTGLCVRCPSPPAVHTRHSAMPKGCFPICISLRSSRTKRAGRRHVHKGNLSLASSSAASSATSHSAKGLSSSVTGKWG